MILWTIWNWQNSSEHLLNFLITRFTDNFKNFIYFSIWGWEIAYALLGRRWRGSLCWRFLGTSGHGFDSRTDLSMHHRWHICKVGLKSVSRLRLEVDMRQYSYYNWVFTSKVLFNLLSSFISKMFIIIPVNNPVYNLFHDNGIWFEIDLFVYFESVLILMFLSTWK